MRVGVEEATVIEIELVLQSKRYIVSYDISDSDIATNANPHLSLGPSPPAKRTIRASKEQSTYL